MNSLQKQLGSRKQELERLVRANSLLERDVLRIRTRQDCIQQIKHLEWKGYWLVSGSGLVWTNDPYWASHVFSRNMKMLGMLLIVVKLRERRQRGTCVSYTVSSILG